MQILARTSLVLALVCHPGLVWAQTESPDADSESSEVETLIQEGIELRRQGQDLVALGKFRQALEINPQSPRVLVQLALAAQASGKWLDAQKYIDQVWHFERHPYVTRHKDTLLKAKELISGHIGRVQVTGNAPGAEIRLNGVLLGNVPMERPIRVEAGQYVLQVKKQGYYPIKREISIAGEVLTREAVTLRREEPGSNLVGNTSSGSPAGGGPVDSTPTNWTAWTLFGLSGASGVASGVAFFTREQAAKRWNDDNQCLRPGLTREEVCGAERDSAESAERLGVITAVAAGALMTGAVVYWALGSQTDESETAALTRCGLGWATVGCEGTF